MWHLSWRPESECWHQLSWRWGLEGPLPAPSHCQSPQGARWRISWCIPLWCNPCSSRLSPGKSWLPRHCDSSCSRGSICPLSEEGGHGGSPPRSTPRLCSLPQEPLQWWAWCPQGWWHRQNCNIGASQSVMVRASPAQLRFSSNFLVALISGGPLSRRNKFSGRFFRWKKFGGRFSGWKNFSVENRYWAASPTRHYTPRGRCRWRCHPSVSSP